MLDKNALIDIFWVQKAKPKKRRVWYYQHPGEAKQILEKGGYRDRFWYYNSPLVNGGGSVGCDTLEGAKGDLRYSGAKVWARLEDTNKNSI